MNVPAWLVCPNTPRCPHPGLLHDIESYDEPRPMCCVDGCLCGRDMEALAREAGLLPEENHVP